MRRHLLPRYFACLNLRGNIGEEILACRFLIETSLFVSGSLVTVRDALAVLLRDFVPAITAVLVPNGYGPLRQQPPPQGQEYPKATKIVSDGNEE